MNKLISPIAVLGFVFCTIFFICGIGVGIEKVHKEAAIVGVGTYIVNPTNGHSVFVWKTGGTNWVYKSVVLEIK